METDCTLEWLNYLTPEELEEYRQLVEAGMGEYLKDLEAYEELLAAGKVKW